MKFFNNSFFLNHKIDKTNFVKNSQKFYKAKQFLPKLN